jgi:hypothetical protein
MGALMLKLIRPVLALVLVVTLSPGLAQAQTKAGVVTNLEGTATKASIAQPQAVDLKFKDDVFQNDRIVTRERSIVRLLLGGKAVVTVRESSALTITEVPGKSTIELQTGKIAVAVAKDRMRPGESVEVKTPNAVAAVRGTTFVVEVEGTTAQAGGAIGGVVTHIFGFTGQVLATFRAGNPLTIGPGNFARGMGNQPPQFGNMSAEQRRGALAGLNTSAKNMAGGGNGAKDSAQETTAATFGEGGGLPAMGGGGPIWTPPTPTPQVFDVCILNPSVCQPVQHEPVIVGGFKPNGTPTGILIFGDFGSSTAQLATDLRGLGKIVTMNTLTLPADLSAFGTIWHASAFTAFTQPEQTRLAAFVALGRGVFLTGERPCCEVMNASLTTFVRSVVVGGSGITIGGQGDVNGPYPFNATAVGGITTGPNALTFWSPSAPGGLVGVAGANVLATGAGGVAVGAVWDSGSLVGGSGRLVLLMDVNWFSGGGAEIPVIANIERFIDDPPTTLTLAGPLFTSTNEQLESAGSVFTIDGYAVVSGGDALFSLNGTRVATAGDFLQMSDSQVSAAGSFVRLRDGAEIVQTSSGTPLVSMRGGTLDVGTGGAGHLFDLAGRADRTQADGDSGLTVGSDRPIQPGAESPVFQATDGAVANVRGSAFRVDTALLDATAPLLKMAAGSSMTTGSNFLDLVRNGKVSIPNDAVSLVNLDRSTLNVNGHFANVAGGSVLNLAGSLAALANGSTLNIWNGLLLNVSGGSSASIGSSLLSFTGSGNLVSVSNNILPTAIINGIPVSGPADSFRISSGLASGTGTGTIKINGVPLTPTTPLSSLTGSLVAVQSGGKVKIGN